MSRFIAIVVGTFLFLIPPVLVNAAEECDHLYIVDGCRQDLIYLKAGDPDYQVWVDLDSYHEPTGVAPATVPGRTGKWTFVAQGAYLRVLHYDGRERLYNLATHTGMPGLTLKQLSAAAPWTVYPDEGDPFEQSALYLTAQDVNVPKFFVLDQQALIAGRSWSEVLIAQGDVCESTGCRGFAADVAVSSTSPGGQEAFVSVVENDPIDASIRYQKFYRISREAGPHGPFQVRLDPWTEEGVEFDGGLQRHLGMAFDPSGWDAWGVYQTGGKVASLYNTDPDACPLPGDPTDVATSEDTVGETVLYVTRQEAGQGYLTAYPPGDCPADPAEMSVEVGERPVAVASSPLQEGRVWAYVIDRAGVSDDDVHAVAFSVAAGQVEWDADASFTTNLEFFECDPSEEPCSCPSAIAYARSACIPIPIRPTRPDPPEWKCLDEQDTAPECDPATSNGGNGDRYLPNPLP